MNLTRNQRAVFLGGAATMVATVLLFVGPLLLPMGDINAVLFQYTGRWMTHNPLLQLRIFGGLVGGFIAGYLARDELGYNNWGFSAQSGLYAGLLGAMLSYLIYVGVNFIGAVFFAGMFPPPFYILLVVPGIYALPLFPAYALEGVLAGVTGNAVNRIMRKDRSEYGENGGQGVE